ncbi:MAG TPA: transglycosylase domain-containing protein [Oligoflexia bacterium]|nr:transglycosylase domain-containing protein [Oligoflexia bacterium]
MKRFAKIHANRIYAVFVLVAVLTGAFLSYSGARIGYSTYRRVFPDISALKHSYPVAVEKKDGKITYKLVYERPERWRSVGQISKKAVSAILAAEDATFWKHGGYSAEAIRAAIEHNAKPNAKIKRGGSTITQQVVKNVFLSPEKTISRKLRELLLSVELERKLPKAKILEIYLNIAEWGPGVYGIEAASWRYFDKPSSLLTAREGAILAFMLPNPIRYKNSYRDGELTKFGSNRVAKILNRLWRSGKISEDEYSASGEPEDQVSSEL